MLFLVFFLLGIYASAAGSQDFGFVCGFEPRPSRVGGATRQSSSVDFSFYQSGTVRPLILFGKLNTLDDPFSLTQLKDRNGNATQSSANLLNPDYVGSLAHYFKEMSYGALTLEDNDGVEGMWFAADSTEVTNIPCLREFRVRLRADGVSGASAPCPAAGETCCKTNMVRAYAVDKENEMKHTIILVLAFLFPLPPVAAQDEGVFEGRPTDFLPLQVGNQWTYEHLYLNPYYNRYEIVGEVVREIDGWGVEEQFELSDPFWTRIQTLWEIPRYPLTAHYEPESPLFDLLYIEHELTLEITHTETIEGHAYFVFSAPPDWPPVPAVCLAGQKVRFSDEGVLLVRWQEQDIALYDLAPPYTPYFRRSVSYVTKEYTTPAYPVLYDAHDPVALPLGIRRAFFLDQAFVACFYVSMIIPFDSLGGGLGYVCFLPDYGLALYQMSEFPDPGDIPSGWNILYPVSAVIDGQVIEYPYSRSARYPGYTHVQPTSWGQLKARHGLRP